MTDEIDLKQQDTDLVETGERVIANFPRSIVYREATVALIILAVAPFKRKPNYWRYRT